MSRHRRPRCAPAMTGLRAAFEPLGPGTQVGSIQKSATVAQRLKCATAHTGHTERAPAATSTCCCQTIEPCSNAHADDACPHPAAARLNDANLVGNVKRVVVARQAHV